MAVIKHGILSIEYLNSDEGMRQKFILDRRASRGPGSSIIVGAPFYDMTNTDDGRVFLWDGSASGLGSDGTPSNADWAMSHIGANYQTGYSVGFFENVYFRGIILGVPGANNVTLWNYAP